MSRENIVAAIRELESKQEKVEKAWGQLGGPSLLSFFADIIPQTLNAERSSLFILDPKQDNVWIKCGTGVEEEEITVPLEGSMVGEVISTGVPQIELDMGERVGVHEEIGIAVKYTTRSALCVPVKSATGEVIGAIQVLNKRSRWFNERDLEVLEQMAFQIQVNIENIYLRQDLRKLARLLSAKVSHLRKKL